VRANPISPYAIPLSLRERARVRANPISLYAIPLSLRERARVRANPISPYAIPLSLRERARVRASFREKLGQRSHKQQKSYSAARSQPAGNHLAFFAGHKHDAMPQTVVCHAFIVGITRQTDFPIAVCGACPNHIPILTDQADCGTAGSRAIIIQNLHHVLLAF
jgi:hypothetical protein